MTTPASTRPERIDALKTALTWLYETEQPPNAVLSHLGTTVYAAHNRRHSLVPLGPDSLPVLTVEVRHERRIRHLFPGQGWHTVPGNPLAPDELDRTTADLAHLGIRVVRRWNGFPAHTGSLLLERPAHPTLRDAVRRYHAGCPAHRSVFCGREQDCTWYADGRDHVIRPPYDTTKEPAR